MVRHWLLNVSELSGLLGGASVRSHLVHTLVQLDRDHSAADVGVPWPQFYERALLEQFARH